MAIDEPDVIDVIGTDDLAGEVVLGISDHLEWDDRNEHLLVLQDKVNRYLAFIESGELQESYARAAGKTVRIDVVCKHAPSPDGEEFLSRVKGIIEGAGIRFSWRVLGT